MKRGHILIVHGDEAMREVIDMHLEQRGYGRPQRYITCFSGPQSAYAFYRAISAGRSFYPALVIAEQDRIIEPFSSEWRGPLRISRDDIQTGEDLLSAIRLGTDDGSGDSRTPVVLIGDRFTIDPAMKAYMAMLRGRANEPDTIIMEREMLPQVDAACRHYLHHKRKAA